MDSCPPSLFIPFLRLPLGCTILRDLHSPTHPFLAVLMRCGGDTCKVSLGREEKRDSIPFPTGMFPAESDPLYRPPQASPRVAGQGEAQVCMDSLHQTRFFSSLRQLGRWEPAEVFQITAGGLEGGLESAEPKTGQGRTPRTWQWISGEFQR